MKATLRALVPTAAGVLLASSAILAIVHGSWRTATVDAAATGGEVSVRVFAWGLSPGVIRVARGQRVRFVVETDDIRHGFAINELGVNLALTPGRPVRSPEIYVALPDGSYAIHCSVFCGLGHGAMKGRLVVGTPRPSPLRLVPWAVSVLAVAATVVLTTWSRSRRA